MELLDLLGEENSDVKKAIQYLLDFEITEAEWYRKKQRFGLSCTEKTAEIDYCTQREHAIDWFFSKALWDKNNQRNNDGIELEKVIKNIQCTPLLVYLAIVTNTLTEEDAKKFVDEMIKELESSKEEYNPKNIRFVEKKELISRINNNDWAKNISQKLIKDRKPGK